MQTINKEKINNLEVLISTHLKQAKMNLHFNTLTKKLCLIKNDESLEKSINHLNDDLISLCANDAACMKANPILIHDILLPKSLAANIANNKFLLTSKPVIDENALQCGCLSLGQSKSAFIKPGDYLLGLGVKNLHASKVLKDFALLKDDEIKLHLFGKIKDFSNILLNNNELFKQAIQVKDEGIQNAICKLLPPQLGVIINKQYLRTPKVFSNLSFCMDEEEINRNYGIGILLAISPDKISLALEKMGAFILGEICLNIKTIIE